MRRCKSPGGFLTFPVDLGGDEIFPFDDGDLDLRNALMTCWQNSGSSGEVSPVSLSKATHQMLVTPALLSHSHLVGIISIHEENKSTDAFRGLTLSNRREIHLNNNIGLMVNNGVKTSWQRGVMFKKSRGVWAHPTWPNFLPCQLRLFNFFLSWINIYRDRNPDVGQFSRIKPNNSYKSRIDLWLAIRGCCNYTVLYCFYSSEYSNNDSVTFWDSINSHIPKIDWAFKEVCESKI